MEDLVAENILYRLPGVLLSGSHCSMDDTRFLHFVNHAVCYLLVKVFGPCAILAVIDCHANRCIE